MYHDYYDYYISYNNWLVSDSVTTISVNHVTDQFKMLQKSILWDYFTCNLRDLLNVPNVE